MPRPLRKPSLAELAQGPRREFVDELFEYFHAARRPALREISDRITQNDALAGTASRETVRRMLGGGVPHRWDTVDAVFLTLCDLAGIDPFEQRWEDTGYGYDDPPSRSAHMAALWNAAVDAPPLPSRAPDGEPPF